MSAPPPRAIAAAVTKVLGLCAFVDDAAMDEDAFSDSGDECRAIRWTGQSEEDGTDAERSDGDNDDNDCDPSRDWESGQSSSESDAGYSTEDSVPPVRRGTCGAGHRTLLSVPVSGKRRRTLPCVTQALDDLARCDYSGRRLDEYLDSTTDVESISDADADADAEHGARGCDTSSSNGLCGGDGKQRTVRQRKRRRLWRCNGTVSSDSDF